MHQRNHMNPRSVDPVHQRVRKLFQRQREGAVRCRGAQAGLAHQNLTSQLETAQQAGRHAAAAFGAAPIERFIKLPLRSGVKKTVINRAWHADQPGLLHHLHQLTRLRLAARVNPVDQSQLLLGGGGEW